MPRPIAFALTIGAVALVAFAVTGPWRIGPADIRRWEVLFAFCVLVLGSTLVSGEVRQYVRRLIESDVAIGRRALIIAIAVVSLFLLRATIAKFHALEVNAWDFSNSFDRPLEQTLHGDVLWSEAVRQSMLGVHAYWLLFAFVPLHAIAATPYWLVVIQALAVAGAAAALFLFTRAATRDDLLAAIVALAFVVNRYVAHATQFVFMIDIFYPLSLFLLFYSFLTEKRRLFALALLLVLSIKEDAIVPLLGFALVAGFVFRRWRWAAVTVAAAIAVFLLDYFVVLPAFSNSSAPWYSGYWASYGATPLHAIAGIAADPVRVMKRVLISSFDLFASTAFVPLIGFEWMLAALPALIVYGSADMEQVRWLSIHYSLPLLPLIFAALPYGAMRIGRRFADPKAASRIVAAVALITSALMGSSYELDAPRSERRHIEAFVKRAGARPLYVQGALLPHAGYASNVRALHHDVVPPPESAFLLCTTCNRYPFSNEELDARIDRLRGGSRYEEIKVDGLALFVPRN